MKSLQSIAKEFNLYQVANIPDRYKNDYFEHRIKCGNQSIPDFFNTLKGYESGLFYECKQDTDYKGVVNYYIEHSYILVKKDNNDLVLMLKADRNKKYWLHPYYDLLHKYHNISYDIKNKALKAITEPNCIGVFTEKKVNDWFNYCYEYINIMDATLAELQDKNKEIQDKIDTFISSIPGCKVSKYHNTTDITTHLFRVTFEHFKDQKYLSSKIVFSGTLSDITQIESELNTTTV